MKALLLALAALATPALAETPDAVARRYGLAGELLVAKGERVLLHRAYGSVDPAGGPSHRTGARWRLASITKQVAATQMVVTTLKAGRSLDAPLPGATLNGVSLRQLLRHHTGLADPDNTTAPAPGAFPGFYTKPVPDLAYCRSKPATPGAAFRYNNCDYIVAADASGTRFRWPTGMRLARAAERLVPGFVGGKPEPRFNLASFGVAGALTGTARDVWRFDRALMAGRIADADALDELWNGDPTDGYQAIGQWAFPGRLRGCAEPVQIVQRDGEIGGVQTRNFILPDRKIAVVVFTNRSSDDFAIGEVWQGRGFAFDLLSAAACPA